MHEVLAKYSLDLLKEKRLNMMKISDFFRAQKHGLSAFLHEHNYSVLIVEMPDQVDAPAVVYKTEQWSIEELRAGISSGAASAPVAVEEKMVLPIIKTANSPWKDRFYLGRARNNDMTLPDPSISKLHAYFSVDKKGRFTLTDMNSANGSLISGKKIPSDKAQRLKPLDALQFGNVKCVYHSAETFFEFLKLKNPS
ncbi:FHA domain-containing protein [Myxococcota bacterium]|nr:FHA domain-containing protein [Myxococcota bacterium]